jgi:hypothetical protein
MDEQFFLTFEEIRSEFARANFTTAENQLQSLQNEYSDISPPIQWHILRWLEAELMLYLCQFAYSDELLSYKLPTEIDGIPKQFIGYYYYVFAMSLYQTATLKEAEKYAQRAITLFEPYSKLLIEASCLLGTILYSLNKIEQAEDVITNASVDAISEDFAYHTALTMETMANFYAYKRDSANAFRLYMQALQFEKDIEGTILLSRLNYKLAGIYLRNNEFSNAVEHLKIANNHINSQDVRSSLEVRYILAKVYFGTKSFDKIPSIVEFMRMQLQSYPSVEMTVNLLMIEAQTFMVLEDFPHALKKTQEALVFAESLRFSDHKLAMCLMILSVYTNVNDSKNSQQYYEQIQDLLEQKPVEKTPYYYLVLFQYSQKFASEEVQFKAYKDYCTAWLEVHNNHIIEHSNFLEAQSRLTKQYSLDPIAMLQETIQHTNTIQEIIEQDTTPDPKKTALVQDLIIMVEEPLLHLHHILHTSFASADYQHIHFSEETHSLMSNVNKYLSKFV